LGNRSGSKDSHNCHNNQQLNQCKAVIALEFSFKTVYLETGGFRINCHLVTTLADNVWHDTLDSKNFFYIQVICGYFQEKTVAAILFMNIC
jgi:hypothetical protein